MTVPQIGLVIALGIVSGVYIYRPLFVAPVKDTDTVDKGKQVVQDFRLKEAHLKFFI